MRKFSVFLMALVMILALAACAAPAGTAATELNDMVTLSATEDILAGTEFGGTTIKVSTMDEFLTALGPDRTILLEPGHYDLTAASDYGKTSENPHYSWEEEGLGNYMLDLYNLRDLTVVGSGMEQTFLEQPSPCETVLQLTSCKNVTFCEFAVGYRGNDSGVLFKDILVLEGSNGIKLEKMEFFGCGSSGVNARRSQDLTVSGSRFCDLECIARLHTCQDVSFRNCEICNIGSQTDWAYCLLENYGNSSVTVENSSISYCNVNMLVQTGGENGTVQIKDTLLRENKVIGSAFSLLEGTVTVDNCSFEGNTVYDWIENDGGRVEDAEGNVMFDEDFRELVDASRKEDTPRQEITVSNIDEFLAALGSNREIRLESGAYNLQDASNYGQQSDSSYYEWEDSDDGHTLVLKDLKDLTIVGRGAGKTVIETLPRTVAVLSLNGCEDITVRDMTMGHVEQAVACEGPVIRLEGTYGINLEGLGLYGCGVIGVDAWRCKRLTVNNCHIYDCSLYGLSLSNCDEVSITNSTIDRIGGWSVLSVDRCTALVVDNCTISDCGGTYLVECWEAPESIVIKNTTFRDNTALFAAFEVAEGENIILENCNFADNDVEAWYDYDKEPCVEDANGTIMTASDFVETHG